jgi:hypothetical protein
VLDLESFIEPKLKFLLSSIIGYGECSSHREQTIASWARQGNSLEGRIESSENSYLFFWVLVLKNLLITRNLATDIAAEMDTLKDSFRHCKTCLKACTAAVEMLAVRLSFNPFYV